MRPTNPMLPVIQYLLDTNILIACLRAQALGQFLEATYQLTTREPTPMVSLVSEGELRSFAALNGWGQFKQQKMEALLGLWIGVPLTYDNAVIAAYTDLDIFCRRAGKALSKNDLWIAATAQITGATLLTTDQDFLPLHPHLIRVEYVDPLSQ